MLLLAKTLRGLEEVLAKELIDLGADNVQLEHRAVSFEGDKALMYKANVHLRTALRILKPIASFAAKDADEVYEAAKAVKWETILSEGQTFAIDATVNSETFRHSGYVTYRVKDALVDRFVELTGKRPSVKLSDPDIRINVHIAAEQVTLSLDSSGESLHKRGWRDATTEAPVNAVLAAGLLLMAGWKGQCDLYDPMCGSGTFLIEAALIAKGIAPGIYRQSFAFERWADFDAALFNDIYNDDSTEREFEHHIYGSDAAFFCCRATEQNIKAAGLQKDITVRQCRIQDLKPDIRTEGAIVIMNPPYGERLSKDGDVCVLYREVGDVLKQRFAGAVAWILSSNEDALKCVGLKPAQRIPVLNGELECHFNCYELFTGAHKDYKRDIAEGKRERREESDYKHHTYSSHRRPDKKDGYKSGRKSDDKPAKMSGRKNDERIDKKFDRQSDRKFVKRGDKKNGKFGDKKFDEKGRVKHATDSHR